MTIGFHSKNGVLHCDGVSLERIAREHGTPAWVYSQALLEARLREFQKAFAKLGSHDLLRAEGQFQPSGHCHLRRDGGGCGYRVGGRACARVVGGRARIEDRVRGRGQDRGRMALALDAGVLQFNVESEPELEALARAAKKRGQVAPVALRVNPDVDAKTHRKITTARAKTNSASRSHMRARSRWPHAN